MAEGADIGDILHLYGFPPAVLAAEDPVVDLAGVASGVLVVEVLAEVEQEGVGDNHITCTIKNFK